ncbi:tripartite tricarboxylate transporter substrate binding protein [Diaphorobacter ruginosibacter]|uniref:Tripartite tricarboxylate transporter substrate binding protein n=1 Tax=Diaphorobacter ruginosibacter TaxID=1715720 RepID=A0A7G9RRJ5_9BURK|nr:tripartite tricarboxylate transporter substrate binding protein [Diaphorobacter ruginosibacter]QNN58220.1 tripartite tricarboxylate transporter substrate binding protein [Diaphorobacter ruginosibacter]
MSLQRRHVLLLPAALFVLNISRAAFAQGAKHWPDKPIRFITPYPPGGSSDIITRIVAQGIAQGLGQSIIVENKPGAGATLGTEYVALAPPDGYTFLVAPMATVTIAPWLKKLRYTSESFIPIAKLSSSYGLVSARKDAPFSNYGEFVAAAKANPGKFTFGSNGVGSVVHLTGVLLHKQTGVDVVHVPYKGAVEAVNDMLGGRIDVMYDPVPAPYVKSGQLKGLATVSPIRNPLLPDLPTLREQGFNTNASSWFGLFAPKDVPDDIVARMAQEARKVMTSEAVKGPLQAASMYADFEDPQTFMKRVQGDAQYFGDVIRKENIKAD